MPFLLQLSARHLGLSGRTIRRMIDLARHTEDDRVAPPRLTYLKVEGPLVGILGYYQEAFLQCSLIGS